MRRREAHIKTGTVDDFAREFIDAWKKAERQALTETKKENIYFVDVALLTKTPL